MTADSIEYRLTKFNHIKLNDIIQSLELSKEFMLLIQNQKSDFDIIESLREAAEYAAALKLLALGLPKREAIWWGFISIKNNDKTQISIMQLVEDWVKQPDENLRRTLGNKVEQIGLYSAAAWLAQAVFWSGGSITPADQTVVEPEHFMCNTAVFNAMQITAQTTSDMAIYYEHTLKRGLHIAMGGNGKIEQG
jgi:hypothetical protein